MNGCPDLLIKSILTVHPFLESTTSEDTSDDVGEFEIDATTNNPNSNPSTAFNIHLRDPTV